MCGDLWWLGEGANYCSHRYLNGSELNSTICKRKFFFPFLGSSNYKYNPRDFKYSGVSI